MRKLLVLVVVVAAIVGGAPWIVGAKAKLGYEAFLAQTFNKNQTPNVHYELKDYKKGWFRSDAVLAVTISNPNAKQTSAHLPFSLDTFTLNFKVDMKHGPVIFGEHGVKFGWGLAHIEPILNPQIKAFVTMVFADQKSQPRLFGTTFLKFSGGYGGSFSIPEFSYQGKNQSARVIWKGMAANWNTDSKINTLAGKFNFAGLEGGFMKTKLDIDKITVNFDLKTLPEFSEVWLGSADWELSQISFSAPNNNKFFLSGLTGNSRTDESNKRINSSLKTKLSKLVVNTDSYGPAEIDIAVNNLDPAALLVAQQQIQKWKQLKFGQKKQDINGIAQNVTLIYSAFEKLIESGMEFEVNKFSVQLPQGSLIANGFVRVKQDTSGQKPAPDMLAKILERVTAKFDASAPIVFVEAAMLDDSVSDIKAEQQQMAKQKKQDNADGERFVPLSNEQITAKAKTMTQQQLASWLQEGFISKQDGNYTVHVAFKANEFTVNGKSVWKVPADFSGTQLKTFKKAA